MDCPVLAYFDPGSGSMLVQLLIGGVAGMLVFARYAWESLPLWFGLRRSTNPRRVDGV